MNVHVKSHDLDVAVAKELMSHHAVMVADLDRLSREFSAAAGDDPTPPRTALSEWIERVLVPHADLEERTTYQACAALPEGRLLIASMVAEHVLIRRMVALFTKSKDPVVAGTYGRAIFEIFQSHQRKENEIILPLLIDSESVSLTELMGRVTGEWAHLWGPTIIGFGQYHYAYASGRAAESGASNQWNRPICRAEEWRRRSQRCVGPCRRDSRRPSSETPPTVRPRRLTRASTRPQWLRTVRRCRIRRPATAGGVGYSAR